MKVAVTDYTFPDLEIERGILGESGCEVVAWKEKKSAAEMPELVHDADVVITQFAPVNKDVIGSMTKARAIVRYGIGVDNVDLEAAKAKGIPVCNIAGFCADEVADHTLAFILATTRQVVTNAVHIRNGNWGLATGLETMHKLRDLTVGVIGLGRIGREVVARLQGFRTRILGYDPALPSKGIEELGVIPADLDRLLAESDVITLHCPSTDETRNLINASTLAKTKRGVIVINLSRGDVVDSEALTKGLQSGQVSAAALDVFNPEPIPVDHPIRSMSNVILAAHISSASVPAVTNLRETTARIALMALKGEPLINIVNGVKQ